MRPKFTSLAEKLEAYSDRSGGPDACWPWLRCHYEAGYGIVNVGGGKSRLAHRVAWEVASGETVPPGLCIRHTCDNPACINPAHLVAGTHRDNTQDMIERGRRGYSGHPGELNPKAKLTAGQVVEIREKYEAGRTSHRKLAAEYGVSYATIKGIVKGKYWRGV